MRRSALHVMVTVAALAIASAAVMVEHIVLPCRALMESYDKAQSVKEKGPETLLTELKPASTPKRQPALVP